MARTSIRFSRLSSMWTMRRFVVSRGRRAGIAGVTSSQCPRISADALSIRRLQRHREMECGSVVLTALRPDAAAVQLDKPFADREPEAGAAGLARERAVETAERLEEPLEVGLANADPRVGDAEVDRRSLGARVHDDPAFGGEL